MKLIIILLGVILMANELKYADSPYLLQHANNPVNWHMLNEKTLKKAKEENKLIFLSIGYSTCHWCHVMERESFENEEIAKILNKYFIPIKVDKEEMPDVDKYYQRIYQIVHNRAGGWPLTIILTPDMKPFYLATYIPPHFSQFGPGLKEILLAIANDFKNNPQKIYKIAKNLDEYQKRVNKTFKKRKVNSDIVDKIIAQAKENIDFTYGGLKGAPKFPTESMFDLLIDVYLLTKNKDIKKAIDVSLKNIALNGLFDQVEGGFFRYSTDSQWKIPHFEKMLYNNANIPYVMLRWYKISKNPLFKEVAFRSLDEMINKFLENELFYSASSADSDGVEGKYYVYEYDEVDRLFNKFENKKELLEFFGIKKYGEFRGKNHLTAKEKKPKNYNEAIKILKKIRKNYPFIDTKKITSWNAMIISALFIAGEFNQKYKVQAAKTLDKLIKVMYKDTLFHSFNKKSKTKALLEDYAFLLKALIDAYEHTYNENYLNFAKKLLNEVKAFKKSDWYMNKEHVVRADFSDSSYSSSLSVLANVFYDFGTLTFDIELVQEAKEIILMAGELVNKYPLYYPTITKAALKDMYGEYVITSKKPLYNYEFDYPYILWKEGKDYELCTAYRCIKSSLNLNDLIKEIQ